MQVCQIPEHSSTADVEDMFCFLLFFTRKNLKGFAFGRGQKGKEWAERSGQRLPGLVAVLEGGVSMCVSKRPRRTHS